MRWVMNCWEILGLEPTSDKKKIKRAYAAKLKTINVEDEAIAFQKLKEAFDSAIFLAGTIIESGRPIEKTTTIAAIEAADEEPPNDIEQKVELKTSKLEHEKTQQTVQKNEEITFEQDSFELKGNNQSITKPETITQSQTNNVEHFDHKLAALYNEMAFFSEVEKWTLLFSDDLEWSIDEHRDISDIMKGFLLANYRVLSKQVIEYIGEFFDFDSLIKDYKSGDYFCYTWAAIKEVPSFSFDIYQNIQLEQRIAYFTDRYELFHLFDNGLPDQALWQERLNSCHAVMTKDQDVINLQIAHLLMNDFRLEQEHTVSSLNELLAEVLALNETNTSGFFRTYYEWVKNEGSANAVLIYDKSEVTIPTTTIDLLTGYVYFRLKRHSRVKECWAELAKKDPALFQSKELAMLQVMEPPQGPLKKEKGVGRNIWAVCLILFALFKIGNSLFRLEERNSYTTPSDIQSFVSGESESKASYFTDEVSDLKESENLYDQFLYYFFINREDTDRDTFVEEHLVGKAKEQAKQMVVSELPKITIESKYDFYSSPDNVSEYGFVTALNLLDEEEPFIILQETNDEKIENVYGEGWELLPQDKFEELWADIQVRPIMSQKFFVVYYLLSDERDQNLKDHSEYVTDNVKQLLEKNSKRPKADEFEGGTWQISQDDEDKLYTIINDEKHDHRYILSYDTYGRLEHIYGENWEKLDANKTKLIYDKAEEEVGVY
ncbi:hypothetical protein [Enterococcus sp. AZ101]|uniref:hypothetical protein n=1 Tax=Enterococcus sp. AZ101 TaxID=2774742 RepID=UPI003D2A6A28